MVEKIIGILGGMGPEATADLYHRIITATNAKSDQEHIKTIIYSNPKIPDFVIIPNIFLYCNALRAFLQLLKK